MARSLLLKLSTPCFVRAVRLRSGARCRSSQTARRTSDAADIRLAFYCAA